jgi:hypothetical protein
MVDIRNITQYELDMLVASCKPEWLYPEDREGTSIRMAVVRDDTVLGMLSVHSIKGKTGCVGLCFPEHPIYVVQSFHYLLAFVFLVLRLETVTANVSRKNERCWKQLVKLAKCRDWARFSQLTWFTDHCSFLFEGRDFLEVMKNEFSLRK